MLFNSYQFFIFFFFVYAGYLIVPRKWQNVLLLISSYLFYAVWNWKFLFLILVSTGIDYVCAQVIEGSKASRIRKIFLWISVGANLSFLGFFKYFNFFLHSISEFLNIFGLYAHPQTLSIVLPIGISFYTFQTMSYTIDVYRKKIQPEKSFINFALYVSFFPQLVAGPIERADRLLPQIRNERKVSLSQFYEGWYLIFWGLFQKVFVADNLAPIVNAAFEPGLSLNFLGILLGTYAFAFQILCDFAGYTNIARGLAKTMGFELMVNFNLPYFARNPKEFWQRWHISLSSWLRDYLYIPLGGNRGFFSKTCRNIFITFILGGLWHGASWTFIVWGFFHALVLIVYQVAGKYHSRKIQIPSVVQIIIFFHVTCFGWMIFRAESMSHLLEMAYAFLHPWENFVLGDLVNAVKDIAFYTWIFIGVQIFQWHKNDLLAVYKMHYFVKAIFYFVCLMLFVLYGVTDAQEFIYFQF